MPLTTRHCLVIGPTKAGKTVLLAALRQAAANRDRARQGLAVSVRPTNQEMKALFWAAQDSPQSGYIPVSATSQMREYHFELSISTRPGGWFGSLARVLRRDTSLVARFLMVDGPGEAFTKNEHGLVQEEREYRDAVVDRLRSAHGLIVCVDGMDTARACEYSRFLPDLLSRVPRPLALERVVICLTKADRKFEECDRTAYDEACKADAIAAAYALMGRAAVNDLVEHYLKGIEVGCVWTSAFGFIEREGSANWEAGDQGRDRLRVRMDHCSSAEAVDSWVPFQLLDPFVFVAAGRVDGISVAVFPAM